MSNACQQRRRWESFYILVDGPLRERCRLKWTWMEVVIIDLKCNLSEDLVQDRLEWGNKIHVDDPNIVRTRLRWWCNHTCMWVCLCTLSWYCLVSILLLLGRHFGILPRAYSLMIIDHNMLVAFLWWTSYFCRLVDSLWSVRTWMFSENWQESVAQLESARSRRLAATRLWVWVMLPIRKKISRATSWWKIHISAFSPTWVPHGSPLLSCRGVPAAWALEVGNPTPSKCRSLSGEKSAIYISFCTLYMAVSLNHEFFLSQLYHAMHSYL